MISLLTGITGFVGSHLADYLLEKAEEVYGTIRWRSKTDNIDHIKNKLKLLHGDLRDLHSLELVIEEAQPTHIFHLASQSFVPMSWIAPADTLETNIIGTSNLFEAVRKSKLNPIIVIAGSSEEYGFVYGKDMPINETTPLRPLSPYAVSKVATDLLGWQYYKSYGMTIIRLRPFNTTGPRRGHVFVCSDFAKQIAQIEKGLQEPVIKIGNLSSDRDFTDVRDMVRAYVLAAEYGVPGAVYNVCSGNNITIREVLFRLVNLSKTNVQIQKDEKKMRPSDVQSLKGDSTKFREKTGWKPEIPLERTLEDLLNYWRAKIK